ncbi:MAG: hypothetical protein FWG83_04930 [Oscillospiraceae bacterium]|nr:hypothetical protein [Oscillospiraceae bacterium]
MALAIEVRERQKFHLQSLLTIKKANHEIIVKDLQREITTAISVMEQEDIAWVEKVVGVTAI